MDKGTENERRKSEKGGWENEKRRCWGDESERGEWREG